MIALGNQPNAAATNAIADQLGDLVGTEKSKVLHHAQVLHKIFLPMKLQNLKKIGSGAQWKSVVRGRAEMAWQTKWLKIRSRGSLDMARLFLVSVPKERGHI